MIYTQESLAALPSRYRASLINNLAGYKQAVLVGSRSAQGLENLAMFNSLIHIGANPALYGLLFRPHTVRRDTLEHILETGFYTFNFMHYDYAMQAHQTSAKYAATESEFTKTGLTPEYLKDHKAPYVKEALIKIGLEKQEIITIQSNQTIMLIGKVIYVELDSTYIQADGMVALEQMEVLGCIGLNSYFKADYRLDFPYATLEPKNE